MEITDIKIVPVKRDDLKAYAIIAVDYSLVIRDLKVIRGPKGYFVGMPYSGEVIGVRSLYLTILPIWEYGRRQWHGPSRIEYDGALYHVTSRGNGRKAIFKDDSDQRAATLVPGIRIDSLFNLALKQLSEAEYRLPA
jgi:hypothetical protein